MERSNPLSFPKSARLLKSSEFQLNAPKRFQTPYFRVLYSVLEGAEKGDAARLGISVSKRVLKGSVQRNRIKRLLRESFRHARPELGSKNIVVIGLAPLAKVWRDLKAEDMRPVFEGMKRRN